MNRNENEQTEEAKQALYKMLKPGQTVYTIVKHVSNSGMMRHIDVFIIKDGEPLNINWYIEQIGLYKRAKSYDAKNANSLRVDGCGMDMGFSVVYNLSSFLWPNGYDCDGTEDCHSNDHTNGKKRKKGIHHNDGGYSLQQRWL